MYLGLDLAHLDKVTQQPHKRINAPHVNSLYLGVPGVGKTELIIRSALELIHDGKPVTVIDPAGRAVDEILKHIPETRQEDVIYFKPSLFPFQFNNLSDVPRETHHVFASIIVSMFSGIWPSQISTVWVDKYARRCATTLLKTPGATWLDFYYLLTDDKRRAEILQYEDDPFLKDIWDGFNVLEKRQRDDQTGSILSRLEAILLDPIVRSVLNQKTNKLTFDKIVLVSLNEAELGRDSAKFLGSLVLASLIASRVSTNVFIDQAHTFPSAILRDLLVRTDCTTAIAVQFLSQLHKDEQDAILGAQKRLVVFRTSLEDSEKLSPQFGLPDNVSTDMEVLEDHQAYTMVGKRYNLLMPRHSYVRTHQEQKIIRRCKSQYSAPND